MTQKRRMNATKRADALFSAAIRARGKCELAPMRPETKCSGVLQTCHLISRRYRAIRWSELNAMAGCQAHHMYFTHHPLEWDEALLKALGAHAYQGLRDLALSGKAQDPLEVIARLSEDREEA
jgi:hypothetical protein